jgi:hypothetical protein
MPLEKPKFYKCVKTLIQFNYLMGLYILGSGTARIKGKAWVYRNGKMELSILVNGSMTKLQDGENSFMQMEMSMRANGKKIWLMARVNTLMLMEQSMTVTGLKTSNMAEVLNHGQMELDMRVNS